MDCTVDGLKKQLLSGDNLLLASNEVRQMAVCTISSEMDLTRLSGAMSNRASNPDGMDGIILQAFSQYI